VVPHRAMVLAVASSPAVWFVGLLCSVPTATATGREGTGAVRTGHELRTAGSPSAAANPRQHMVQDGCVDFADPRASPWRARSVRRAGDQTLQAPGPARKSCSGSSATWVMAKAGRAGRCALGTTSFPWLTARTVSGASSARGRLRGRPEAAFTDTMDSLSRTHGAIRARRSTGRPIRTRPRSAEMSSCGASGGPVAISAGQSGVRPLRARPAGPVTEDVLGTETHKRLARRTWSVAEVAPVTSCSVHPGRGRPSEPPRARLVRTLRGQPRTSGWWPRPDGSRSDGIGPAESLGTSTSTRNCRVAVPTIVPSTETEKKCSSAQTRAIHGDAQGDVIPSRSRVYVASGGDVNVKRRGARPADPTRFAPVMVTVTGPRANR
jgi:hypothetical protein